MNNNNELILSIKSKTLSKESKQIISSGISMIGSIIDTKSTIPFFNIVTSITNGIVSVREYRTLKMIAHFFEGFETLDWNERTEFIYNLENHKDYEDFSEKILFYLDSIQDKKKAKWIGKMTLALARNKISLPQFEQSVFVIINSMPGDLELLQISIQQSINERENDLISKDDWEWFEKFVFKYIGLHYFDDKGHLQKLSNRVINHFISLGLMEWDLKKILKPNRSLGLDDVYNTEEYIKDYTYSRIATLIYFLALKDD